MFIFPPSPISFYLSTFFLSYHFFLMNVFLHYHIDQFYLKSLFFIHFVSFLRCFPVLSNKNVFMSTLPSSLVYLIFSSQCWLVPHDFCPFFICLNFFPYIVAEKPVSIVAIDVFFFVNLILHIFVLILFQYCCRTYPILSYFGSVTTSRGIIVFIPCVRT